MRIASLVVLMASFAAATASGADAVVPQAQPESAAAPVAEQQVPAAAVTPEAAVSAPKQARPEDAAISQSDPGASAPAEFKAPAGYKAVKRGFDTVYCKSVKPIGSRVPERVCYSRQEMEAIERRAEQDRQNLKQMSRPIGNVNGG